MSIYIFDESNYASFDAKKLVIEVSKTDVGQYHVSYFNIKYVADDGATVPIKVKTPVLSTPFGVNMNQFGKTQLTLNVPNGSPLHVFLSSFQTAVKNYICDHIKFFDKNSKTAKLDITTFEILSTAFDILKHRDDGKYDDTVVLDISSAISQRMVRVFDKNRRPVRVSFEEGDADYIGDVVPAHSELCVSFRINSVCMYGELKQRKFVIKKDLNHVLLVSTPSSAEDCDFGAADDCDDDDDGASGSGYGRRADNLDEDGFAEF